MAQRKQKRDPKDKARRKFLKQSAATLGGAYLGFYAPRFLRLGPQAGQSPNMQYRMLGNTGLKVSEVGFGGFPVRDPRVVEYAIDKGVNYIDTAWDYQGGVSEETIGKALGYRRKEVVITTKWHPWAKTTAREMMAQLDTSLRRLRTDHVDCLLVHQVGKASGGEGIERLQNPELFKAMDQAKRQGKARFFGCSGHDGDLMEVMNYAISIPEFSVILCRFNFMAYPQEPGLFKKAREKGIGVCVMKTLAGARGIDLSGFRDKHATYKQGALKWVLSNSDLSNLVISISSREQVDEYTQASGGAMLPEEGAALAAYAATFGTQVCRLCNACEPACPQGVKVADISRFRMYEKEYGWKGVGRERYAQIHQSHQGSECLNCAAPCMKHCEYGVDIKGEMTEAHRILSGPKIT